VTELAYFARYTKKRRVLARPGKVTDRMGSTSPRFDRFPIPADLDVPRLETARVSALALPPGRAKVQVAAIARPMRNFPGLANSYAVRPGPGCGCVAAERAPFRFIAIRRPRAMVTPRTLMAAGL